MSGEAAVKCEGHGGGRAWTIENAHLSVQRVLDGLGLNLGAVAAHPHEAHNLRHYTRVLTEVRSADAVSWFVEG